jgi:hypothetical protein
VSAAYQEAAAESGQKAVFFIAKRRAFKTPCAHGGAEGHLAARLVGIRFLGFRRIGWMFCIS